MYGEWLALHQVLADKLYYTVLIKLSMLFKFWGCGYLYTWQHFLDLGLAVTEI